MPSENQNVMKTNVYIRMKRTAFIILALCLAMPLIAQKRLSKEEFREKQKAYFVQVMKLTDAEAEQFFPLYFELQELKKSVNDEAWREARAIKADQEVPDKEYQRILEGIYDARVATDRLEKTYFDKYRKFLSYKKIFLLQKAEMGFHRELLKGMHRGGEGALHRGKKE